MGAAGLARGREGWGHLPLEQQRGALGTELVQQSRIVVQQEWKAVQVACLGNVKGILAVVKLDHRAVAVPYCKIVFHSHVLKMLH